MPRTRVTEIRPVIRDTVIGTPGDLARVADNPNTHTMTDLSRVGPNQVRAVVERVGPPAPVRRTRRVAITIDPGAARTARQVGRLAAVLAAIPTLLAAAGWAVWALWSAAIISAATTAAGYASLLLSVIVIAWLASAKAGVCPGYHCPGCPHRK